SQLFARVSSESSSKLSTNRTIGSRSIRTSPGYRAAMPWSPEGRVARAISPARAGACALSNRKKMSAMDMPCNEAHRTRRSVPSHSLRKGFVMDLHRSVQASFLRIVVLRQFSYQRCELWLSSAGLKELAHSPEAAGRACYHDVGKLKPVQERRVAVL